MLHGETIIQQLWRDGDDWDTVLKDEVCKAWAEYRADLMRLSEVSFPRYAANGSELQLHVCCDTLKLTYKACIYVWSNAGSECRLMCAKMKVAPLKEVTIPRLELCAASLAGSQVD